MCYETTVVQVHFQVNFEQATYYLKPELHQIHISGAKYRLERLIDPHSSYNPNHHASCEKQTSLDDYEPPSIARNPRSQSRDAEKTPTGHTTIVSCESPGRLFTHSGAGPSCFREKFHSNRPSWIRWVSRFVSRFRLRMFISIPSFVDTLGTNTLN